MASSKRPTCIVETRLATERKRRKSDLVIMWQSIWDVTSIIITEFWMTLLKLWESVQLWFSSSERFEILAWLEKYLPVVPDNFSDSWRDGRLLAILLNKLQPGCFPDAQQLDPDFGLRNVYKAFGVLEVYFGIKPDVSVEEIVICIEGSDSKLFGILVELKRLTESKPGDENPPEAEPKENNEHHYISQSCIAKGTGLAVGFVGRITNFIIFCAFISDIDVVIEIKGPNTICSERITKRSPKKKLSVSSWDFPRYLIRSESFSEEKDHLLTEQEDNLEKRIISLEYEIIGNQISVGYRPKEMGQHKVSILWHGQHVSDSPYFVAVEDPLKITSTNQVYHRRSALKAANEGDKTEPRKNSVRFQESQVRYKDESKPLGRVLSKRILRYIVKINGKDIPVNAESTDALATELLKMDYDFESCPSLHRRNSWGFTGDAERKKSVIRQFCIDVNELEGQINLRRSRSLSINNGSRKFLEKCDSFDNLTPRLNIVSEHLYESCENFHENESDYAYLTETATLEEKDTKNNGENEFQVNATIEKDTKSLEMPNESLQSNSLDYSDQQSEVECDQISSLSTPESQADLVDKSIEDHGANISNNDLNPSLDHSDIETTVKSSFNCGDSFSECNNNHHHCKENANGYETFKSAEKLVCGKYRTKYSKNKKYSKDKYWVRTKKIRKSTKQPSCNKSIRNTNLVSETPQTPTRNIRGSKKAMLKTKEYTSMNAMDCHKHPDTVKLKYQRNQDEVNQIQTDSTSREIKDVSNNFSTKQNSSMIVEAWCVKNNEESPVSRVNQTFRNIVYPEEMRGKCGALKCDIQDPEIKKSVLTHNLYAIVPPSTQSWVKRKDTSYQERKTFRTHTLRTVGQLNFKQFNPSADEESCISPIKSQIDQWESTLSADNPKSPVKKNNTSETEQVSVKEKLAFWEKACKTGQNSLTQNNKKINLLDNKKAQKSVEGKTNAVNDDLHNFQGTGKKSTIIPTAVIKTKTVTRNFVTKDTNLSAKKDIDFKIVPQLHVNTDKIRRRSFSDPGVSEATLHQNGDLSDLPSLESSTTGYVNSSNDDNLEDYFSDDSQDYVQNSSGDEYIDDEISGSASEYWGDLSIVKDLKGVQCSNEDCFSSTDYLHNPQLLLKSFPEECKVFGIAVYYGYVAEKNRFQVYTGDAGFGNLSVSIQGFRRHDVSLVSVAYVRKDIYEVIYQVMTSGYYLISVRWLDKEIPGSPFVCKVTF